MRLRDYLSVVRVLLMKQVVTEGGNGKDLELSNELFENSEDQNMDKGHKMAEV